LKPAANGWPLPSNNAAADRSDWRDSVEEAAAIMLSVSILVRIEKRHD
jgi:hypothetical protein